MSAYLEAKRITTICGVAFLLRCLPFAGSYCRFSWCAVSKTITDLGKDLLACVDWDFSTLFSPHVDELLETKLLSDGMPFGPALPPDALVPLYPCSKIDDLIDGLGTVRYSDFN